jgi:hypothetical protein
MTIQPVGIIDCLTDVIAKAESFLGIGRPQIPLRRGEQPAKKHSKWRIGPDPVGFREGDAVSTKARSAVVRDASSEAFFTADAASPVTTGGASPPPGQ